MSVSSENISPNKKYYAESNGALLNVFSRESKTQIHSIALNQYDLRKPDIFRWSSDSQAIGMFIARGIPYDAGGYMSVRTNYWIGIWYPFQNEFYTVHFPNKTDLESNYEPINSIEVLAEERTVICSHKGKEFKRVAMPKEQMLSNWDKEKRVLESVKTKPFDSNKKEWTWNEDQYGYEGVHLYEGQVLWFTHTHNPHGGGGANGQSFEDFLANGASGSLPSEYFQELYDAVSVLASRKNRKQEEN